MFTELLFFMLSAVGLTHILVDGTIFKSLREFVKQRSSFLYDLVSCHQCCGMWVGFIMAICWAVRDNQVTFKDVPIYLCAGFATSFLAMLGKALMIYWTFGTDIVIQDNNAKTPQ